MADALIDKVRLILQDVAKTVWTTDTELNEAISQALKEFSVKCPDESVETLATVARSRDVDLSSLSDLVGNYRNSIEWVEYPVDQYPEKFRNFEIRGTSLRIRIDSTPSASDENVYVGCRKIWDESTLKDNYVDIVADLAAAKAAINKPMSYINALMNEDNWTGIDTAIGNMSARIAQAIADLAAGRKVLNDVYYGNATSASTGKLIDSSAHFQTWGIGPGWTIRNRTDNTTTTVVTVDSETQLTLTDDIMATSESYSVKDIVATMVEQLEQAIADIATAKTYFNKINISNPETEYLNTAGEELSTALGYIRQMQGYTENEAMGQLKIASLLLQQAQGYLARFNAKSVMAKIIAQYEAWGMTRYTVALTKIKAVEIPFDRYSRGNSQRHRSG